MMAKLYSSQKGVSLIAAIFIIVVLAFMGVMFVSLIGTSSFTSVNDLQSGQALYVAEGGAEYVVENQPFPNYSLTAATNLGAGSFTVATPTYLTIDPGVAGTTITVNSTAIFPAAGRIVIDSELINYTGTTATTFTGATRAASGTTATTHPVGNAVYPVTTVADNPLAAGSATINVASTVGFLIPGIIKIDEEYIYCTGTNATTQFTGCTRQYKGSTADSHPQLRNVFQSVATSTGTVGNTKRQVKKTVVGTGNSFYKGWFAKATAAGNQAITGVGFQPTAVIFYWTRRNATGFAANESMGFGFASGAGNQRSIAIEADDNVNPTNYSHIRSDTSVILVLVAPAGGGANATLGARANLVTLDSDGFTINWVTNEARADIIHFIALGRDVTNAYVGTFAANTATGNQIVIGPTFTPNFVMLLNGNITAAATETVNTAYAVKYFNIGFMTPANQGAISVCGRDARAATTHPYNEQQTTQAFMSMTTTCTQDSLANYVSMNANGFTINWSNAPAAAIPIFYLALQGGQHKLGAITQPNAVLGNQITAGVGFQPQGLFLASFNKAAIAGIQLIGEITIGAASAAGQGTIWSESRNLLPNDATMGTLSNAVFLAATGTGAGSGTATTNAQASFVGFNSDSFTLNWTTADATTRQILYWTVGPNVARSGANIKPVNLDWREVFP